MKPESRILGIDDAPFNKYKDKKTMLVGVVYRGGNFMDGVISGSASVDGSNATKEISKMIMKSKFKDDLRCIMLKGIGVAGLNMVNIEEIYEKTKIPVLVVMRKKPDKARLIKTLEKLGMKEKALLVKKAGRISKINNLYVQSAGLDRAKVKELLGITTTHSAIPEPIRVAHLIAGGIINGESKGKA